MCNHAIYFCVKRWQRLYKWKLQYYKICLDGAGWLAKGCVWVVLSIWTCKIIIISVKLSLSSLLHVWVPGQSINLFVLNSVLHWVRYDCSIALVAEKNEKKSNHILYAIPQELVTLVYRRDSDKYSCCNTLSLLQNTCFHWCIYNMHVEHIDVYVVMSLRWWNWIPNQF